MSRGAEAQVVSASRLREGDAVWLAADGRWSTRIEDAELITDADRAKQRLAEAEAQSGLVVDAYLAAARPGPRGPEPVHFREAFRTRGPSNYAHGKQAEARDVRS